MNKDFLETISKTFQRRFPCVSRTDDVAVILVGNKSMILNSTTFYLIPYITSALIDLFHWKE